MFVVKSTIQTPGEMPNDKAFSEMNSWNSDWGDDGANKVCNILCLKVKEN